MSNPSRRRDGVRARRETSHRRGVQALRELRAGQVTQAVRNVVRAFRAWPFAPFDPSTYIQLRRYQQQAGDKKARHRDKLVSLIESLRPVDPGVELIRLGPDGDGGYLLPDDLEGVEYAFSPGVGSNSGFEADLASRGVRVYMADFSVERPRQTNPAFRFERKHVGSFASPTTMTMDEWKQRAIGSYGGDLLLQMDIESAEYETLTNLSSALQSQFRIVIVEFHNLHELWSPPWFMFAAKVFEKLLTTHSVVHIHPNNSGGSFKKHGIEIPSVAEFTFLRSDRVTSHTPRRTFPHPLDQDCSTDFPPLVLPECWYRDA